MGVKSMFLLSTAGAVCTCFDQPLL